jgi:DNA ligase-associated metallophosphoesterase
VRIVFGNEDWELRPSGALWWPAGKTLVVADLHLGKAESLAARGYVLPPHASVETLTRLEREMAAKDPRRVICLGDAFHDEDRVHGLPEEQRHQLAAMAEGRDWTWITGNHDGRGLRRARGGDETGTPGRAEFLPGTVADEAWLGEVGLRHEPAGGREPGGCPVVYGHFHPKRRVKLGRRCLSRPAFLWTDLVLVLPAFGALTGGLDQRHPELVDLLGPVPRAALLWRDRVIRVE